MMVAFVMGHCLQGQEEDVCSAIMKIPEVKSIDIVLGAYDFIAKIEFETPTQFKLVEKQILYVEGVTNILSLRALDELIKKVEE